MPNLLLSKLNVNGTLYDLKDAYAREALDALGTAAAKDFEATLTDGANLPTGAAVKAYVDAQVATIHKFDVVIDAAGTASGPSVTASAATMYKLYLVPDAQSAAGDYIEWITVRSGSEGSYEYAWEKIGSTKTDLSDYVPKTTTVAGIALDHNISVAELEDEDALDLKALAHKASASGSYTKATGIAAAEYTPAGDVEVVLEHESTAMTSTGAYTPAGEISIPTITVTPSTDTVVGAVTNAGSVPTFEEGAFTPASLTYSTSDSFAKAGVVVSVGTGQDAETLILTDALTGTASVISAFSGGSKAADTWDAGAMPSFSSKTVATGIASATSSKPEFEGTAASISVSGNYLKASVQSASFDGTAASIAPTLQTASDTITVQ